MVVYMERLFLKEYATVGEVELKLVDIYDNVY